MELDEIINPDCQTIENKIGGKYLTFILGSESYGISVSYVREIMRIQPVTPIPQLPEEVKGVINLRGKIIPVIDLKCHFGMHDVTPTETECIVVVRIKTQSQKTLNLGLIVDAVEEVTMIAEKEIEPPPEFGVALPASFMIGMAKVKGKVKTLLDIYNILTPERLQKMEQTIKEGGL